ncbi:poly(A) polymerase [Agaricicola taiwanensis]|uniref:Poly(A) polymerase n=1 Tax=Agaricicola taiwanensis TaxID=591372 RepID=A0A8J2VU97_9RHOB|nr:CCA tRNA nucleotidyltransferase [Agaricicola taiwanensis]GGE40009.1 poly(A) polymerase [Agaricicola taiwanensis]
MNDPRSALDDPAVSCVLAVLDGDGEEARIVGGAVRNLLRGQPVEDFDIATSAVPQDVMRRAEAAGIKAIPTGIDHGTVTLVVKGRPFEVTTLRRDTETDGRHATVVFGRDWAEDAQRRDFTFNALSMDRHGVVHDTTGGQADLEAGKVRFIGDARQRIREDYLRSLRFFRFHASYGRGALDEAGLSAVIAEREGLTRLSRERIRSELMKLLIAPGAVDTIAVMAGTGILGRLLGGVPRVSRLGAMTRVETHAGLKPDALRRLGALFVGVTEDADRLRERLRLSNRDHAALLALGDGVPPVRRVGQSSVEWRRLAYGFGAEAFQARVLAAWAAEGGADDRAWRDVWDFASRYQPPLLPWTGGDLIARGLAGAEVGQGLRRLEEAWIEADFSSEPRILGQLLEKAIPTRR